MADSYHDVVLPPRKYIVFYMYTNIFINFTIHAGNVELMETMATVDASNAANHDGQTPNTHKCDNTHRDQSHQQAMFRC